MINILIFVFNCTAVGDVYAAHVKVVVVGVLPYFSSEPILEVPGGTLEGV